MPPDAVADAGKLHYDVASVRKGERDPRGYTATFSSPVHAGRIDFVNIRLNNLITLGYGLNGYQLTGGPDWADKELFTIHARSDEATDAVLARMSDKEATQTKQRMLQALLIERFRLQTHWTTKDLPVYTLIPTNSGPKFTKADPAETPAIENRCDSKGCLFAGHNQPIGRLLGMLAGQTGGEVQDKTGLSGRYDFELRWNGMTASDMAEDNGSDAVPAPPLPTALQEQLGLKLGATKAPVKVLVVDHVEMPTEN